MIRPALHLLLIALVALALAACGGDEYSDDGGGSGDGSSGAASDTDEGASEASEGSEEEDSGGSAGEVIELGVVDDELKFDPDTLDAKAGTVTLRLTNDDSIPHNIALKDGDETMEEGEIVADGDVSEITVELEAGKEYMFYCTPHEGAGMTGTLTVA